MSRECQRNKKKIHDWKNFFHFIAHAKFNWLLVFLSFGLRMYQQYFIVDLPGSTAEVFAGDFSKAAIWGLIIYYVCSGAIGTANSFLSGFAKARSLRNIRTQMWERMLRTKSKEYSESAPEYMLSAITNDAENVVTGVFSLLSLIPHMYYIYLAANAVSNYSPKLLLVFVILIPVYIIYTFIIGRWTYRTSYSIQSHIGKLTDYLSERIRSLNVIKSFATEEKEEKNGQNAIYSLFRAKMQNNYIATVDTAWYYINEIIVNVIVVLWGASLLRNGEIDLEGWLAFFLYVPVLTTYLNIISGDYISIQKLLGNLIRVNQVMDAPQEEVKEDAPAFENGDIRFEQVSFSYAGTPTLTNIDFTIPKGKLTAVIGISGSGKTTLIKLIERLYEPETGTIKLGNRNIVDFDLLDYRRHFAYVQQGAEVFGGTFREILTYGVDEPVPESALVDVAKQVGILDFINAQPGKFDCEVAYWGNSLSGGQRQRLVIARELLKNADILLMDEPTSALDAATAREIRNLIVKAFDKKTVVIITHDLGLISHADQIVVMEQGRVEGCASHSDLMKTCERYKELVTEQSYQEVFGS